jgi:hypothetical protein
MPVFDSVNVLQPTAVSYGEPAFVTMHAACAVDEEAKDINGKSSGMLVIRQQHWVLLAMNQESSTLSDPAGVRRFI